MIVYLINHTLNVNYKTRDFHLLLQILVYIVYTVFNM